MRREQKITLYYWLAAAAFAVVLMPLAPLIEHSTRNGQIGTVVVALIIALICLAKAVSLAWKEEESESPTERRRKMLPLIGMVIFGIGFLGCATWFFWPINTEEQKLPGFTAYAVIRLYDSPDFRRRYVFEFVSSEGAKASFYLSASSVFTFSATDVRGESYPLEVKLGDGGIPIDQFVVLFCEIGVAKNSTTIRVLVNEKEVARRGLSFPLNLGKMDWKAGALGAPVIGTNQSGVFLLSEIGVWPTTMTSTEVHALVENAAGSYNQLTAIFGGSQSLRGAADGTAITPPTPKPITSPPLKETGRFLLEPGKNKKAFSVDNTNPDALTYKEVQETNAAVNSNTSEPPNVLSVFVHDIKILDLSGTIISAHVDLDIGPNKFRVFYYAIYNFQANSKYLSVFISHSSYTFGIVQGLTQGYKNMFDAIESRLGTDFQQQGQAGVSRTWELPFSGRINVYTDDQFDPDQLGILSKLFKDNGASPSFFSTDYVLGGWNNIRLGLAAPIGLYELRGNPPEIASVLPKPTP